LKNFNQVIEANQNEPDPQALFYQGLALSAKGDGKAANSAYEKSINRYSTEDIEVQPEDFPLLARLIAFLADSIEQKKASNQDYSPEYKQAQKLFSKAEPLAQNPALKDQISEANLIYNRGSLDARTQNLQGALEFYGRTPSNSKYLKALTLRSKGSVYLLLQNRNKAAESFQQAQQVYPDRQVSQDPNQVNICLFNPTNQAACNSSFNQLSSTFFKQAFPMLWMYECNYYPVLSVVDQPNQSLCSMKDLT
jgi:tetratricopeptide (TPR) repeat protein